MTYEEKQMRQVKMNVHFQNEVRKVFNEATQPVLDMLKPFLGTKVKKADGIRTKKVDDAVLAAKEDKNILDINMPVIPFEKGDFASIHQLDVFFNSYDVILEVCICFSSPNTCLPDGYCHYARESRYLGDIQDQILVDMQEIYEKEDMIALETELQNWLKVQALIKQAQEVNDTLSTENKIKLPYL